MKNTLLGSAYSSEDFRKRGHELIDSLADHLEQTTLGKSEKVLDWVLPKDEHHYWTDFLKNGDENALFKTIMSRSIHVHHPKYIGHQVSPPAPITALTGLIGSLLNNGMAVYEMGKAATAMELIITDLLCEKLGYEPKAGGILTSGGTLANLTALLAARKAMLPNDIWNEGHSQKLAIMVSEQAHYCIDRAAKIMGLGEKGIIKIPTTSNFTMDITALETSLAQVKKEGIEVFAIVGSAPSTATGMYDDLKAIANFSKKNKLWFHVDGAHGGAAIFSAKYKNKLKGISEADSVVIDGHKMMMMPTITTALLFKNRAHSHATFSQKADYLLEQSTEEDWYNLAKRTFECTKSMMSLHWYTLLKTYGETIFDDFVTSLYDLGQGFAEIIRNHSSFELAVDPMSNIVCFRYVSTKLDTTSLNSINEKIRLAILEEGEFYIVQTKLRGIHYLRTTIMNPYTTPAHLEILLDKAEALATANLPTAENS
ncbi:L-2,4-diaminobutyrate decarboxylase [Arenibacter nanhaiticus]|uniref:L-2,4-diaminobutyrate decarboxylase n=1 Tax=Arenibacter nanhaiticus TaxID=558155 RepID=A0A1M6E9N1_9FLAO|nr:aminotransferase class I/II-fold pyridoxal phosphate-dependent enzyme [Arenibacter nanhaiticus]SHI82155.1 L-2,4-diaminobutyrate decarboxylase [Arenibacter nanhaiticus]